MKITCLLKKYPYLCCVNNQKLKVMSRTKEYIESMMELGIDVLSDEAPELIEQKYLESLQDMNRFFTEENNKEENED